MPNDDGLDTPRTVLAPDTTYMSRVQEFDISAEPSFHSPNKSGNVLDQLRNGRAGGISLRTPRGGRAPLNDVRNLPTGLGGPEFTPLLKSATRKSALGYGKENGHRTSPTLTGLNKIDEDMTPIHATEASIYSKSTSYVDTTPYPEVDSSSVASTPFVMPARRGDKGPLQDGNQLSLREQENVIDKIEKENFGLKLKIHFLEEALRKSGPGYSEAALRENTELKVDKATMQRELHKYKKHLNNAEKDIEDYRQQMVDMHEKIKRKNVDEGLRAELDHVRKVLEDRECELEEIQHDVDAQKRSQDKFEKLQDDVEDLEANLKTKSDKISEQEDEIEELQLKLKRAEANAAEYSSREADIEELEEEMRTKDRSLREQKDEVDSLRDKLSDMEAKMKDTQRQVMELEEKAAASSKLEEAKETIEDLEADVRRLEDQAEDLKEKIRDAIVEKERAENDRDELQDEMANKSLVTKGLSKQIEQKLIRLQNELEESKDEALSLSMQLEDKQRESSGLKVKIKSLQDERDAVQQDHRALLAEIKRLKDTAQGLADEKALLRTRHDTMTAEATSLERDISKMEKNVRELEDALDQERTHSLEVERSLRSQYKEEINRLQDDVSSLQGEIRERDNLYDNESEKWERERQNLECEQKRAHERATGLQRTIEKLRETEGSLSSKEQRLQQALDSEAERHKDETDTLKQQIESLQKDIEQRQSMVTDLGKEIFSVRDELRQTRLDHQTELAKVQGLEDEVEVLQTALEGTDSAQRDLATAKAECAAFKQQLQVLKKELEIARSSKSDSAEAAKQTSESLDLLQNQLSESTAALATARREKQVIQEQLAKLNLELSSMRTNLVNVTAERDEIAAELKRSAAAGEETVRLDAERIELRAARTKLESEVKRLKEENRAINGARLHLEKTLEDEIEKAAEEEDRLADEIRELQAKVRQSQTGPRADSRELAAAKRTVRDLERKVQDLESQLAVALPSAPGNDGNSELSLIRRDLSAARQKELEFASKEAQHRDVIKGLKKQIAELERRAYEAELSKIMDSPRGSPSIGSVAKKEAHELRNQLVAAHKALSDSKSKLHEAEKKAHAERAELQTQMHDLEDLRTSLEERLEDLSREAQEASEKQERVVRKLKARLEKIEITERQNRLRCQDDETVTSPFGKNERKELVEMLRTAQEEAEKLAKDVRFHKSELEAHVAGESGLRKKLERARNERAKYRASAEKTARDVKKLKYRVEDAEERAVVAKEMADDAQQQIERVEREKEELLRKDDGADTEAIVRAAEQAEHRHQKELRGMLLQMEWMQARWQREAALRFDAAYAKRFLRLQLDIAEAWLVFLPFILSFLKPSRSPILTFSFLSLSPSTYVCQTLYANPLRTHPPTATRLISAFSTRSIVTWVCRRRPFPTSPVARRRLPPRESRPSGLLPSHSGSWRGPGLLRRSGERRRRFGRSWKRSCRI